MQIFQSTLPARGATLNLLYGEIDYEISIHAPREGSDGICGIGWKVEIIISIHAPREGSDQEISVPYARIYHFNPRSPRGERLQHGFPSLLDGGISIHAPREGSDHFTIRDNATISPISIHAPREGSDTIIVYHAYTILYFNPRSPRGERPRIPLDQKAA